MGPNRTGLKFGSVKAQHWKSEILFTSGDEYFNSLLNAIQNATKTIEFESYIFEKSTIADRLVDAMIKASRRGVQVRIIVDGWGSPGFIHDYWPKLKAAKIKVRFFRVIPWVLKRLPGDPQSFRRRIFERLLKMNRGNHRKLCLIDRALLWVGSFNVSDVHLKEVMGDQAWKDIGLCVTGPEVRYAFKAFQRAFRGWRALLLPSRSPNLLLLNDTVLHQRNTRIRHIQHIKKASTRIWLATPYFAPIGKIFRLLIKKARAGVDVRLIVPYQNDVWLMKWISLPLLRALSIKKVKVFVYSPRFSHQKIFIADEWICIGSTNLNHRSFLHDLELDIVVTRAENKEKILENYMLDQSESLIFDSSAWANLPFWKRLLSSMALLLKYWS